MVEVVVGIVAGLGAVAALRGLRRAWAGTSPGALDAILCDCDCDDDEESATPPTADLLTSRTS